MEGLENLLDYGAFFAFAFINGAAMAMLTSHLHKSYHNFKKDKEEYSSGGFSYQPRFSDYMWLNHRRNERK